MRHGQQLFVLWGVLSIVSMFSYAFAGFSFWSTITSDDAMRVLVLIAFHVGGVIALLTI